jgi:putative selenium metabolism hydrolase
MDFKKIRELGKRYEPDMTRFLRDMIAIPSESCNEKSVVLRIKEEMEKVGFDKVEIDPMGNILGTIGNGKHVIAMDAHIDTVGIGNKDNWKFDPYLGMEDSEIIGGRGASDQEGGMASMVYAGKIIKDLGLTGDYSLVVVGSVQEEDCDGLCWQYIYEQDKLRPEFVVSTEPTDGRIHRGQRGRMEIRVKTTGVSCHGSAPERGDNAIYKMAPILLELRALHENLKDDPFLGKGSLAVSEIFFTSPSRCAVADSCWISIDRRLTFGEDGEYALNQIRNLPSVKAAQAEVSMYTYERPRTPNWSTPRSAIFLRGSSKTTIGSPTRWSTLSRTPWSGSPWWINGPSPPTASRSWGVTAFPASATGPARRPRPTPPTKSPGKKIWSSALPSTPRFP